MRFIYYSAAILLGVLIFAGCNSKDSKSTVSTRSTPTTSTTTGPETTYADGARRITIHEAQDLIKSGKAYVVDVRNQASYDAGHIPGAKLIPADQILNHVAELPRDKTIITYCS